MAHNETKPRKVDAMNALRILEAMEAEYKQEAYRFAMAIRDEAQTYDPAELADDEGNPSIDVRLQVFEDGGYTFHSGDASYDQDHRGFWGAASVGPDDDDQACVMIGRDLADQALDHAAQSLA